MPQHFLDRDTSWVDFNNRVLYYATDKDVPLLERVNFLSITSANLDEFFQVRLSSLLDEKNPHKKKFSETQELLQNLITKTHEFCEKQEKIYRSLVKELNSHKIHISEINELDDETKGWTSEYFDEHIYPVLTPLAVDPAHPFPWISSLSINLAFILREPKTNTQRFARVKIPTNLDRLIKVPNTNTFIPLENFVKHYWERLFPGMDLESHFTFRVTRSSQYKLDEADDLLEAMSTIVRRHQKFGRAVRLEIEKGIDDTWLELLQNEITLENSRVFHISSLIDLTDLHKIAKLDIPKLRYPVWQPRVPARLNKIPTKRANLFAELKNRDLLIHRPYESYEETVEALVRQASRDENVLAIKQTLYRAASVDSPIVQSLCRAAEEGKQVVALVELKARFEEQANIERAKKLERSGVHVLYGKVGLKTHAKLLHIVREEGDSISYYSHISTGNYNPSTAGIYEDFDLFTSDQRIGRDVGDLFNNLTGYTNIENFRELLVAPNQMRDSLLELINSQSNEQGSIVLKCNNIVDEEILTAICDAEKAGAEIKIIVRSSCGLKPKTIAKHPNIKVISIIGRFLEHSRVYKFGNGDDSKIYIGSADLMVRNLDHRVEVLTPVYSEHTRRYINEALTELLDNENEHWELTPTGWEHIKTFNSAHKSLMDIALYRSDTQRKLSDAERNMPEQFMNDQE
ncbi:MAG: polyphosphate kinase 1 [Acidimicrobiia bacterium]